MKCTGKNNNVSSNKNTEPWIWNSNKSQGQFTNNKFENVQIEVQKGQDGLWLIKPMNGKLFIEDIPPYLGVSQSKC